MPEPIPFHQWKDEQVKKDSREHGSLFFRERDWYWKAYGAYCNKVRQK